MELEAELKRHCVVNASPVVPKVGEPCCAMFPGETVTLCGFTRPMSPGRNTWFSCYLFCFLLQMTESGIVSW